MNMSVGFAFVDLLGEAQRYILPLPTVCGDRFWFKISVVSLFHEVQDKEFQTLMV